MSKQRFIFLFAITLIIVILTILAVKLNAPQIKSSKEKLFPQLAGQIESIQHITIKTSAAEINMTRHDQGFGIDEFDGYPALADKVSQAIIGIADLTINAKKTALPKHYHRLGVEDPNTKDTTALHVTLADKNRLALAKLIIGKPRLSSAASINPGFYARQPDSRQSYLVDGVVNIAATKTFWIERVLFDIPAIAIKSVHITHADGNTYALFKSAPDQGKFELADIAANERLASDLIINPFGTILENMQTSGVRNKDLIVQAKDLIRAEISTFDGIIATITVFQYENIPYASFTFSLDANLPDTNTDKIRGVVDDLNARTEGWLFAIADFKYDILAKRSDMLIISDK